MLSADKSAATFYWDSNRKGGNQNPTGDNKVVNFLCRPAEMWSPLRIPGTFPQRFLLQTWGKISSNLRIRATFCCKQHINTPGAFFPLRSNIPRYKTPPLNKMDCPSVIRLMCCLLLLLASRSPPQPPPCKSCILSRTRRGIIQGNSTASLIKQREPEPKPASSDRTEP